jgi:hypothetical protein
MKQLNLFKESDRKLPRQEEKLVVDKKNLVLWKRWKVVVYTPPAPGRGQHQQSRKLVIALFVRNAGIRPKTLEIKSF